MKKIKFIMCGVFLLALFVVSLGSVIAEDKDFSANENRFLAKLPSLDWDDVLEGDFQEDLETYLNDHILGRDSWISIKTRVQKLLGDTDIGGVYLGEDDYYFEKITDEDIDPSQIEKNISYVKDYFQYCDEYLDASKLEVMLVPTAGLVLEDKLPAYAPMFDQETYLDQIESALEGYNVVDVRGALSAATEGQLYYRTDHHWTSQGAMLAYEQWCNQTGRTFPGWDALKKQTVTEEFRGSLYSKVLDPKSAYDEIWYYTVDGKDYSHLTVVGDEKELPGVFDNSKLEEKDKYLFFMGDNYGEAIITNSQVEEGENLLIIKDSFANCFTYLTTDEFHNVHMIDLRYFRGDLREYLLENEITEVLVLYNISNFATDKNLHKLR